MSGGTKMEARGTIRALDGLRGVAALGIVIYHMRESLAYAPELAFAADDFEKYYLLLDLFFVVSGFGIAAGYGRLFESGFAARDYGRFIWGRLARLYPLYLAVLLVLAAQETFYLYTVSQGLWDPGYLPWQRPFADGPTFVTSVLMVQAWGLHDKLVWNIPAWYVSALFAAYLAFPLIAWLSGRIPKAQRGPFLIIAAGGAALLLHAAYQAERLPAPGDVAPLRAILEFMIGYGIAQLAPGPAWRRHLQLPLIVMVLVSLHLEWRDEITLTAMVAFFWSMLDDRGVAARVLGLRPFVFLGAISYAIFLVHQPMLSWFDGLNNTSLSTSLWLLWSEYFTWNIALRLGLIVLAGWAAQRLIAEPARRWMDRMADSSPRR